MNRSSIATYGERSISWSRRSVKTGIRSLISAARRSLSSWVVQPFRLARSSLRTTMPGTSVSKRGRRGSRSPALRIFRRLLLMRRKRRTNIVAQNRPREQDARKASGMDPSLVLFPLLSPLRTQTAPATVLVAAPLAVLTLSLSRIQWAAWSRICQQCLGLLL